MIINRVQSGDQMKKTEKKARMIIIAILATLTITTTVSSGEIQKKYLEMREQVEDSVLSAEKKKVTLEKNLYIAMKLSTLRYFKYCDYKNVQIVSENYEKSEINPYMYFFQYKDFTGYFIFKNNPEKYQQLPEDEMILIQPGTVVSQLGDKKCAQGNQIKTGGPDTNGK